MKAPRPLIVTTMPRLAAGFSGTPPVRVWVARCRPCGTPLRGLIVARSARLDRPGWHACMAAAHAHIAEHQQGGRL